eukprot:GILI01007315.1.p2 GENE.GILI01007315.1~~GILI01007315.1.p2  ORF type:complete len:133 (-),score=24.54 GILI01007315.1:294-692(-)
MASAASNVASTVARAAARVARPRKAVLSITDSAANRIRELLSKRTDPCVGLKVGVRKRGCNGLTYTMNYAEKVEKLDEVVEDKGVTVVVDSKAVMFLTGAQMDFVEDRIRSEFVFHNPNAKGACGCGESFNV